MDIHAQLAAPLPVERVFEVVADLSTYPDWLDIVGRVAAAPPDAADPGPAWWVDLRAQLGPLRRSKRLRMVRSTLAAPRSVGFERAEVDGRQHSAWSLAAVLRPTDDGCDLTMHLHYGGSLWVPILDRVMRDEIERSRPRLVRHVEERVGPQAP